MSHAIGRFSSTTAGTENNWGCGRIEEGRRERDREREGGRKKERERERERETEGGRERVRDRRRRARLFSSSQDRSHALIHVAVLFGVENHPSKTESY